MANSSAQVERRNGGGSGKPPERPTTTHAPAAYSHACAYAYARAYAHAKAFVSLAVKGSGLLALLLSTVILLGGFVSSLGKTDFFCITAITAVQAAGIFQDCEKCLEYALSLVDTLRVPIYSTARNFRLKVHWMSYCMLFLISYLLAVVLGLPLLVVVLCAQLFYMYGPLACAVISAWRIAKLNHGNTNSNSDSMANMMAALNIFYSLIIFQGTMLVLLLPSIFYEENVVDFIRSLEQLQAKWGKYTIHMYLYYIGAKCKKDPLSTKGWDLIKYGTELLDSESQEDYLDGARLLSAYITKGEDVRCLLLPSSHKIQKLIDSLWISSGSVVDENNDTEIRELAAKIVAHLAGHIDVARYPGAMRCISSLLQEDTTRTYRCISDAQRRPMGPLAKRKQQVQTAERQMREVRERMIVTNPKRLGIREERRRQKREGGTSYELILQGLIILERLASNNDDNRSIICGAPGLLPKITAPVYSPTLIEDVKTKAWADIITRSLKVLYQLIRSPDGSHEIFSNNVQALSNLKSILELGNNEADHQELQLVAMDILTELSLDFSINLTDEIKKVLITKQLQLFLLANEDDEEESAAIAGRAMVSLSTNSESNSALIMTTQDDIIGCLTGILVDVLITRRTIAAEIMANLCAHCNVDNMKEILPKVLKRIMTIKTKSQQRKASADQKNPALGDEENQGNPGSTNAEERRNISTRGKHTETEEITDQEREEQEAFLSLAQVICDKLTSADLDGAIQMAVQNENSAGSEEQRRRETFVDKLKTIIDGNCHPAADSLRIVKLCGQIAKSVMQCKQYVEIFRNKGFKSSLSVASKTLSELESSMLFVGTDFGPKKTVRPLLCEIEKTWPEM